MSLRADSDAPDSATCSDSMEAPASETTSAACSAPRIHDTAADGKHADAVAARAAAAFFLRDCMVLLAPPTSTAKARAACLQLYMPSKNTQINGYETNAAYI